MAQEYTATDLHRKMNEVMSKVRNGETVTITHWGHPIAEIKPISPFANKPEAE